MKGKRIIITGGTGFLGTHLAEKLKSRNQVWVVGKHKAVGQTGIRFVNMDVRDGKFLDFIRRNTFDYFFHLAGNTDHELTLKNPAYEFEIDTSATFRILDVLRGVKRKPKFVFASSVMVYGEAGENKLSEDSSLTVPIDVYGASKLASEHFLRVFCRLYGLKGISLRIFSTYGPGLKRLFVYDLMSKLAGNPNKLEIMGNGREMRDLTYVEDQIGQMIRVAERADYRGEAYNLASGKLYSVKKVAEDIARSMKLKPKFVFTKNIRAFDSRVWVPDLRKIRGFGCRAATPLREGIEKTLEWYRSIH